MDNEIIIQTYSSGLLDLNSNNLKFSITDIAHSLSMQCRFNGHCPDFYSVAQHSVIASHLVPEGYELQALLHDAAEFCIGDLISPIKRTLGTDFKELENHLLEKIFRQFKIPFPQHEIITMVDLVLLATEKEHFFGSVKGWKLPYLAIPKSLISIKPISHKKAEKAFLTRYYDIICNTGVSDCAKYYKALSYMGNCVYQNSII